MAKKWSDVAASSAFQALSYEEQEEARRQYFDEIVAPRVPTEDIDLVRGQFLADTTIKRPQPVDNTQIDYGDAATSMQGTPGPSDNRSLIARLSDALKPAPKPSVMEGYQPTAEQRQAAIDQRLNLGAGPISQQTVQQAADVRAGRARTTDPLVSKVAKSMEQQNTPTIESLIQRTNNPVVQEMVRDEKAAEFRSVGEWAIDTLSGLSQGVVSLPQLPINFIAPSSEIAETLRQTQKEWQAAESDVLKAQREQLRQRVQQEEGFLGKYYVTVKQMIDSPALTISEAAKQVPMFLGVLGAARLGAAAAGTGVNVAGRVSPTVALSDAISGGAIQAGARAAGSTAGGVGASMVMAGGDAAGGVYEKLTDPEQTPMSVWEKNEDFQQLIAQGKTADQAIEEIATTKARMAAMITAPLGLLGFAGAEAAIASRGLGRATREALTLGGAGKFVAKDLVGEQLEEGGTQAGGNVIARTVDPNVKLTEGVPEAMGQALVTAAPFSVLGAASQAQEAARAMRLTNFTPSGSPTQRAGMVDIVIPVPDAPIAVGGLDVSTAGSPSGTLAGGVGRESPVAIGSVDVAGRDLDRTAGLPGGAIGGVRAGDRQDDALRGGLPERPANLTGTSPIPRASDADLLARTEAAISENNNAVVQPSQQWFGRKGDGYATEADAGQALPGRQRMFPALDWKVEQMPSGKYRLAGYSQETNLVTQAAQTLESQTQGQQATQVADATQGVVSTGETAAGATLELSGAERAGLKLALPAPASTLGAVKTALVKQRGVEVDAIPVAELNDSQRVASAVGRLLGRTVTFVRAVKGDAQQVPNGMVNRLGGKHIFVASNTDDAPLTVTMHEAYHGLPATRRKQLNAALLETFASDRKGEFQTEFGYDDAKFEEEAPAMIAQAVSKRADFWEELRTKMGNKEFGEVAKVILDKLTQIVTGAKKEYGDAFVSKYIKDVDRARSLLTDAYAEAMTAQGKQADVVGIDIAASNRAGQKNEAASRISDTSADRFKRTPALQQALADLQAGVITRNDYNKVVDEARPVYPYKELPEITTESAARYALANGRGQSPEKAAKYGLPAKELTQGEMVQLRLDIPSYQEHEAWVVTVHRPRTTNRSVQTAYDAGKPLGYESVASITNATFGMRQSSALKIAQGTSKGTIATVLGEWKPITPAEAKVKAQEALKSKEWTQVGMDPFRHSYFYDRDSMRPVVAADEVIQIGPLVLARNAKFDDEIDVTGAPLMFSEKSRGEPSMNTLLQQRIDENFDAAVAEYSALKDAKGGKLIDTDLVRELSPEYRADKTRAAEVHDAASNMTQRMFEARIDSAPPKSEILFMAGGGGAGKSSAKDLLARVQESAHTVLDGTLSGYDKAKRNVERALSKGHRVAIAYIYREPVEALQNGVLSRAMKTRRAVPLDALVKGHAGSSEVVRKLQAEFGDNPNFVVYAIDNSRGAGKAALVPLESITPVIKSGLKERLLNATETEYQAGRIDDGIYRATLEGFPDAAGATRSPALAQEDGQPLSGSVQGRPGPVGSRDAVDEPAMSERAGEYRYEKDEKGRITFNKDIDRVRFLARDVKPSKVEGNSITFKAEDATKVIKALETEPKVDSNIAAAIKTALKLTNKELASTSLEYQTGEPKDRAFVAPLKGGIPEVVKFLEDRRRASGLRLLDVANPEDQDIVAKLMAAETLAAIRSAGNALEWYDETIARTLAMAAVKYPELQTDRNAQMIFRLAMAITSQGLNVENNLKFTMRQYDAYRKTGKYPEVGEGDSAQAMTGNFKLANELMAEMGIDLFRRFLVTPFTIGELNAAGFEPGGELIDETVLGSSVFGPKIGFGFYSNLNGNFEPVTMDMWFMRTIGRLTGSLRAFDAEKFGGQLARLREALTQTGDDGVFADQFDPGLVERAAADQDAAIELARQVSRAHEKDFKVNRAAFDAKVRKKSQLVLAADTMIQSLDKPRDVPASGGERRLLREVVRKAVAKVEKAYGQRIPPAAMQALIWYPEQELYKAMGVKLSVTSQDYAGATEKVLKEEGYDEQRLRAAAESGSRSIRQANASDVGQGSQGNGQGSGSAGPLEGQARQQFIRDRYERTQLAKERLEPKRRNVIFEVAPDPNNATLTDLWRTLDPAQRLAVSDRVARTIVPRVLAEFNTDGILAEQVGSYLDDTNPSFSLLLNKGDPVEIAKTLGFVLAQDSMMVVSPTEFKGGEKNAAIVIQVGDKTPQEIESIYNTLREIEVNGERPIGGQSYANGGMTVLNFSGVPTAQLAVLIDQKLNKAYSILTREVFAAFPDKQEYDYASSTNDGRGSRAVLRQRARDLRSEATAALEQELRAEGIEFSNRSDAASSGRAGGGVAEETREVVPSYGKPREGATSAVGYHYSRQQRSNLVSSAYGTGLKGAEMDRLRNADPALRSRIYFYIDRGTGINPEAGVGGFAHRVRLDNLYDMDADAQRLARDNRSANAFESAVMRAGFDGYMTRDAGPSGVAVLLGKHMVRVQQLGSQTRMKTGNVVPAAERVLNAAEQIAANRSLPSGQMDGPSWARMVKAMMPEVYAQYEASPVWSTSQNMYKDELARKLNEMDLNSPFEVIFSNRTKMAPIEEPGQFDAKPGEEITVVRLASMPGLDNTNAASPKGLATYLSMVDDFESAAGGEAQASDTIYVYRVKVPEGGFGGYSMQRGGRSVVEEGGAQTAGRTKAKYGGYWYSFPQGTEAALLGSIPLNQARASLGKVSDEIFSARQEPGGPPYTPGSRQSRNFDFVGTKIGGQGVVRALQDAGFDFDENGVAFSERRRLPVVSPQSALDADIRRGAAAVKRAVERLRADPSYAMSRQPIVIGRVPHVLGLLRVSTQDLEINPNILNKIFVEKHASEFASVTPEQFVRALYRPAMVLQSRKLESEKELVLPITGDIGAVIVPINTAGAQSRENAFVISAYQRRIVDPGDRNADTILRRVNEGAARYVDLALAKPALTGRPNEKAPTESRPGDRREWSGDQRSGTTPSNPLATSRTSPLQMLTEAGRPFNKFFVPWPAVAPKLRTMVADKKVKTDVDLMRWIGDNYKAESSPQGLADTPAFSNRRQRLSTIGSRFTLPAPSMTDDARRALQDDALRMKRVIDAVNDQGGTVTEAQNFYDANTLMPGRIQAAMDDFKSQIVQPMIDKAVRYDIDLDELALYAYAKHAEERNNYIASINNRMPDGGSGMTTADANTILQQVQSSPKAQQYEELHRDLMAIASTTRQIMLSEGLITQDEFLSLDGAYANYIPLRGLENVDDEGRVRPGVGRGFNIRGKETIRALGRRSRASDLIENVLRDYERVVMRVEKNDVGKVLLDFVLSNPDPDLWDVDVERSKPSFNKTTGLVQYTKQVEKGEDTIGVKVGGQQVYIKLADTDLARAIRQSWKDEVSGFERAVVAMSGWWNNWMRNMLTRYNPAFAAINIPRDALWSGTTAALAELGAKGLASYLANYPQALLQSSKSELGGQTSTRYQEFRNSGGITGGFYMRGLEDIQKDLRNEMLAAGAKPRGAIERIKAARTYKLARLTLKTLEFLGAASENATRFALFAAARDVGRTPVQAALLAKHGTTNFNRKGEWGGALNNLYLFYNAAVQGTAQLVRVLRSPAVVSAMAGVAGIGAMLAFYGASAGGEDDDGEAYWDKIPSYVKERNMVIMLPPGEPLADGIQRVGKRGRYFTVPVQFGFNIFPNLGYVIADSVRNQQDPKRGLTPTKAALHMTSVTFGSINPFGGAVDVTDGVQVLLAVMPTLADLPIQLATERGTFGTPSAPTKSSFDKKPDSERMFTSQQGTVPARIAQVLNEMTGGNEAKEGALSVTPGTIQTLISSTTGGLGSFIEQVGSSILAMSGDDKDIKAAKIPFLNKFYGEVDETANIRAAGDRAREIKKVAEEVKEQARVGLEPKLDDDEKRLLNLAGVAEAYNQAISQMRKQEIQIIRDPKLTESQKNLERRQIQVERDKLATEVNREYLNSLGAKR